MTCTDKVVPPVIVARNNITLIVGHPGIRHTRSEIEIGILLSISRLFGLRIQPQTLVIKVKHLFAVHRVQFVGRSLEAVASREVHLSLTLGTFL